MEELYTRYHMGFCPLANQIEIFQNFTARAKYWAIAGQPLYLENAICVKPVYQRLNQDILFNWTNFTSFMLKWRQDPGESDFDYYWGMCVRTSK